MQDLLTIEELAKRFKVSKTFIYRKAKEIPHIKLGHRTIRFVAEEVEQWLKSQYNHKLSNQNNNNGSNNNNKSNYSKKATKSSNHEKQNK